MADGVTIHTSPAPPQIELPPDLVAVIRECRRHCDGGVFFDVGANVGHSAEALVGRASKVVAIEADPATFAEMTTRLGDSAVCVNALVEAAENEERTWLHNSVLSTGSTSVCIGDEPKGHDYLQPSRMRTRTLDSIAREHGWPDVIKLDVEGAELAVLAGAAEALSRRPVVVLEFNAFALTAFARLNPRCALDRICEMFASVSCIRGEGLELISDRYAWLGHHMLHANPPCVDNLVCTF